MELVIFSGLQASGKSSFYRERFATSHTLISRDLMGNSRNKEARQLELIASELAAGRSVVVDNTNPTREIRSGLVQLAHRFGAKVIGYSFASTVSDSVRRNEAREGRAKIPKVGIFTTAKKLTRIGYDEGLDEIFLVRLTENGFEMEPLAR